jgi:hypothetical protein
MPFIGQPTPQIGPTPLVDNTQLVSQLMIASAANDGAINALDSSSYMDNGKGINARYQFAYHKPDGVAQLGGVDIQARGNGAIGITQLANEDIATELRPLLIQPARLRLYNRLTRGQSDTWALRVHTVNDGDWWEVGTAALWVNLLWPWTRSR